MYVTNPRPSYYAIQALDIYRKPRPFTVQIMEISGRETNQICTLDARGDLINNIAKRGIPWDDAVKLGYEIGEMNLKPRRPRPKPTPIQTTFDNHTVTIVCDGWGNHQRN